MRTGSFAFPKRICRFLLYLLCTLLWNIEGLLPAAVLLALHLWLRLPLLWSAIAATVWIVGVIVHMLVIGWANRCDNAPTRQKENKNPYSVSNRETKM